MTVTQTADPAAVMFSTNSGMVLHAVKPASVSDYEAAIIALQDAFSKSNDEDVKRVAAGWRVWKAAETDAKANVIYVHMLQPTTADVDYRPSLWLDRAARGRPGGAAGEVSRFVCGGPKQAIAERVGEHVGGAGCAGKRDPRETGQ